MKFKEYIAKQLVGQTLHFVCDCAAHLDVTGTIKDYEVHGNETVYVVDVDGRIIRIGDNHPNMQIK